MSYTVTSYSDNTIFIGNVRLRKGFAVDVPDDGLPQLIRLAALGQLSYFSASNDQDTNEISFAVLAERVASNSLLVNRTYEINNVAGRPRYRFDGESVRHVTEPGFGVAYPITATGIIFGNSARFYGIRCVTAGTIICYDNIAASGTVVKTSSAMTPDQFIGYGGAARLLFSGLYATVTGGTYEALIDPIV